MGSKARRGVSARAEAPDRSADLLNAVFLVGFMGAGKSSVGRALGQRLNWDFEDLDDHIQRREGCSVAEIFRNSGEQQFRQAEHDALKHVLADLGGAGGRIIALGGGAFIQQNNAALLAEAKFPTVFLDAPVKELWRRCSQQATDCGAGRPLLQSEEQFRQLYDARRDAYSRASLMIETSNRTVEAIAGEIVETLGLKKIEIRVEEGEVE
jgi:shikimate kinase